MQCVSSSATNEHVVAEVSPQSLCTGIAGNGVVALAANDEIIATGCTDKVVTSSSEDDIRFIGAENDVALRCWTFTKRQVDGHRCIMTVGRTLQNRDRPPRGSQNGVVGAPQPWLDSDGAAAIRIDRQRCTASGDRIRSAGPTVNDRLVVDCQAGGWCGQIRCGRRVGCRCHDVSLHR